MKTTNSDLDSNTLPTANNQNIVKIGFGLLVVLIVGLALLVVSKLNTPARVKEKLTTTQPIFLDYSRSVKNIASHLTSESSGSDADSIDRYVQKGESYLKEAETFGKSLDGSISSMNIGELKEYKKRLEDAKSKANELVDSEREAMDWAKAIVDPMRKYQDYALELSGISNYLYSDPEKYTRMIGEFLTKDKEVINTIEKIEASGDIREMNKAIVSKMRDEYAFLESVKNAVTKRDIKAIAEAEKKYALASQDTAKELSRIGDKMDERYNDLSKDFDNLVDRQKEEYDRLRNTYKI